uniref:EF-hand domain-containing protein n=1 Tax=Mastacembelus armatus TaxID=205130 RepID=A0A3Q3M6E2_9TELE
MCMFTCVPVPLLLHCNICAESKLFIIPGSQIKRVDAKNGCISSLWRVKSIEEVHTLDSYSLDSAVYMRNTELSPQRRLPQMGTYVYMSSHEHRFRMFSSVEYEGQLYMTPQNFIESVTMSEPRNKRPWRSLTKQELEKILSDTPPEHTQTQTHTHPHAGFKIAFNMFDADGNQMVDKREFLVLQEIFRKKNEKKGRKGDAEKSAQLVRKLIAQDKVLKKDSQEFVVRSYWDVLRRSASQVLFSDLAERADESITIDTTLLVHFFGKKGKAELTFDDFYRFMDNLQTEVLEIEFLTYSKGMTTISEEDFAKILLRFTNVDNISAYLDNVRQCIPDEKGITFDEFRSFFQFLNNLEDFAIAMQMYNFASRSIGQDEFARAVYVATGLKLTRHLVNTIFKIFDVDHDDQLSYKEFIGIMKDRLHRGARVRNTGAPHVKLLKAI